ncbi:unnamed protein product [Sphagnum tenellum]
MAAKIDGKRLPCIGQIRLHELVLTGDMARAKKAVRNVLQSELAHVNEDPTLPAFISVLLPPLIRLSLTDAKV